MRPLLLLTTLLTACGASVRPAEAPRAAASADEAPAPDPCALHFVAGATSPRGLSPDVYTRAMATLVPALCTCTRHGDELQVEARVVPARGEIRATADDARVTQCLSELLSPGRFPRDERGAATPLPEILAVPLVADRKREQLRDPTAPRAPTYEE